jgi:hypothetical protein
MDLVGALHDDVCPAKYSRRWKEKRNEMVNDVTRLGVEGVRSRKVLSRDHLLHHYTP